MNHKDKLKDHKDKLKDHTNHMLILDHKDKLKDHKDHKLHHVVDHRDHELIQRMIQLLLSQRMIELLLSQMHNHKVKDLLDLHHGLSVPIDEAFMKFLFCLKMLLFASSRTYMTSTCCLLLV